MAEILRIVGTIAGIGGISLGIVLLIYRDFVRDFIQARVFKTLSAAQATILLGATIVFTFVIAIVGIFVGFIRDGGSLSFILLVAILLLFILTLLYMYTRQMSVSERPSDFQESNIFFDVYKLLEDLKIDAADKKLAKANHAQVDSAEFWYWKSRIAFARGNERVALAYAEEALQRQPRHVHSLALKIKLLLLRGNRGDRAKAKELAEKSFGISDSLDIWLNCLKAENVFTPGPRTNQELDTKCSIPVYEWND